MSDTTYQDYNQSIPVVAAWLNDVNIAVYRAIGTGGVAPTTAAQVLANIGGTTATATASAIAAAFASPPALGSTAPAAVNATSGTFSGEITSNVTAGSYGLNLPAGNAYIQGSGYFGGGLLGHTAAAAAGTIGERIESVYTAVGMTSATLTNLTSISLTAGVWDVGATGDIATSALTALTSGAYGVSSTSVTLPAAGRYQQFQYGTPTGAGTIAPLTAPSTRFVLTTTTTVYLVARATVASGTLTAEGTMYAVRAA